MWFLFSLLWLRYTYDKKISAPLYVTELNLYFGWKIWVQKFTLNSLKIHNTFKVKSPLLSFKIQFIESVIRYNSHISLILHFYVHLLCLADEYGSSCHGSVLQGQFEGTIHTHNGTYHIEPLHRYTSSPTDHHSIIYHEEDVGKADFILWGIFFKRFQVQMLLQWVSLSIQDWFMCILRENVSKLHPRCCPDAMQMMGIECKEKFFATLNVIYDRQKFLLASLKDKKGGQNTSPHCYILGIQNP